jgi:heme exporter protein B
VKKIITNQDVESAQQNKPIRFMNASLKNIATLLKKDLLLEWRQQYTFFGILIYLASTTFVIYLTMGLPEDKVWNGLYWITLLFICINAVARSFKAMLK